MRTVFKRAVLILNGAALFLCAAALVDFLLHPLATDYTFNSTVFRAVSILALTPLTLLAGFLIIRRVPGNIVGPLLILWSVTVAHGSIRVDIAPLLFALFYYFDFIGWIALFLMVLHFPNGEIYPARFSSWIYCLVGIILALISLIFLSSAYYQVPGQVANPFHLPALTVWADFFNRFGVIVLSPILVHSLVSPVLRYRKGSPLERQQIKLLALFGGFIVIYVLLGLILIPLLTGGEVMNPGSSLFAMLFYISVGLFPPIAIGVAVLRYRLWDIDILIRRTLVYSILSAIMILVYLTSVIVIQNILAFIFQLDASYIASLISTLVIAVLFIPLRRRIQNAIDLRFYRQKYDAEKVLASFTSTLRYETDLEILTDSILKVVNKTVQPAHVSMWLREIDPQEQKQQFK